MYPMSDATMAAATRRGAGPISPPEVVGVTRATGTGVTPPEHEAGYTLIAFAMRQNTGTPAALADGWTDISPTAVANAPSLRAAYKVAESDEEDCTGFTDAQSVICVSVRDAGSIIANAGTKQTAATSTTINWLGLSLSDPALVLGVTLAGSDSDPALRDDLGELANYTISGGSGGRVRVGQSAGMQAAWDSAPSVKTLGAVNSRAIAFELGIYGVTP